MLLAVNSQSEVCLRQESKSFSAPSIDFSLGALWRGKVTKSATEAWQPLLSGREMSGIQAEMVQALFPHLMKTCIFIQIPKRELIHFTANIWVQTKIFNSSWVSLPQKFGSPVFDRDKPRLQLTRHPAWDYCWPDVLTGFSCLFFAPLPQRREALRCSLPNLNSAVTPSCKFTWVEMWVVDDFCFF